MKRIKNIFLATVFIAVASSCTKLEEYNPSGATADAVWNTPEGFKTLVNSAYSELRYIYGKEDGVFMTESGTDLWFNANKANYANQFSRYENLSGASPSYANNYWRNIYKAINLCNAGLGRIDKAGLVNIEERNKKEGELRFLRAFYYWHVVEIWGGVILRTTETQGAILTAERSSVEEFYKLILSDLEKAADLLPNNWINGSVNEYARPTKKAALGLLARAYLSRAYYSNGADRNEYFTKARNTAKDVINRQAEFGVSLYSKYSDIFTKENNKKNKEALFSIVNSTTNPLQNYDSNGNRLHGFFLTTYGGRYGLERSVAYGHDGQKKLQPTLALLDFFDEVKDSRYSATFQEVWIANTSFTWGQSQVNTQRKNNSVLGKVMTIGKDTAMLITKKRIANKASLPYLVVDRDSMYNTNSNNTIKSPSDFIAMVKYMDGYRTTASEQPGYNDVLLLRLAEMYLIAAEAEHQLGNDNGAIENINVLRTRAAKKTPVDYTADMQVKQSEITSAGSMLDFILDERARELAGEHLRWFDLKRTGKLLERVQRYNPDITLLKSHHVVRPIPNGELDALLNRNEFGQNEGYD